MSQKCVHCGQEVCNPKTCPLFGSLCQCCKMKQVGTKGVLCSECYVNTRCINPRCHDDQTIGYKGFCWKCAGAFDMGYNSPKQVIQFPTVPELSNCTKLNCNNTPSNLTTTSLASFNTPSILPLVDKETGDRLREYFLRQCSLCGNKVHDSTLINSMCEKCHANPEKVLAQLAHD